MPWALFFAYSMKTYRCPLLSIGFGCLALKGLPAFRRYIIYEEKTKKKFGPLKVLCYIHVLDCSEKGIVKINVILLLSERP